MYVCSARSDFYTDKLVRERSLRTQRERERGERGINLGEAKLKMDGVVCFRNRIFVLQERKRIDTDKDREEGQSKLITS